MKTAIVFGTRPEAIKMCPVIHELKKREKMETLIWLTGQHKEMLDSVMDIFNIKADVNLDIMQERQSLGMITTSVIAGIDKLLVETKPDILLVHGDTTTSYAAALAGFYRQIPVGHVEAGLRTYDLLKPFPEEFNRRSVDVISSLLFAPTESAKGNLLREEKEAKDIYVTGNTVIDALKTTVDYDFIDENLEWASDSKLLLLTAHRRENQGEKMIKMFRAIRKVVDEHADLKCIYPAHSNPIVKNAAREAFRSAERVRVIDPLDVVSFHNYMARSFLVVTDSGGIQEEAPAMGVPVLVMRDKTERPEGIEAGTVKLIGTEEAGIYKGIKELLDNQGIYEEMSHAVNPYGDGHASERIVDAIIERYG